ncbi:hypothetical protein [Acidiferrobacter sp.]|uniref:hypothetical protein n=1 Tax=Acidiferrobacter sp. TaxID=1872107 RepID=UPI002632DED4|nr:hypothetical protein [Acidiferrobacter sp.]
MKFSCNGKDFEIPDSWQTKAKVLGWTSAATFYPAAADPHYPTVVIPLHFIAPPERDPGTPWFDEARMVRILQGLRSGIPLPPIEIHEPPDKSMFRYAIRDGFHRFYASAALGFTHLPVTVYPYFAFDS